MITVFTPTYNRAYILEKLFESLMKQTVSGFEWLIIDDGSTDNTKDLVECFDTNGKFKIEYIYKKNEGKHSAINLAAKVAQGEWLFIVDSDDRLTPDALETIQYYLNTICDNESFAGVVGLRADSSGNIWQEVKCQIKNTNNELLTKKEYIDATAIEYRYKYKIKGDRAEVLKREILKKYPFPVIEGEHFMQESYLWYALAVDGYQFRWFNKIIYITEYLEDGLTKNGRQVAMKNPKSKMVVENFQQSINQLPLRERIKSSINYYRYGKFAGESYISLFKNSTNKVLALCAIIVATLKKIH